MARQDFPPENFNFLAVASYMVYKVMVDWIKVLKVCVSKRHSLRKVLYFVGIVCDGVNKVSYGVRKVSDGVRKVSDGDRSVSHGGL